MQVKRYNPFSEELKRVFGCRVQRLSIDAGFSCPHRIGNPASGGCIFCGGNGSGAKGVLPGVPVIEQLEQSKEVMTRKYKAKNFLAYFQAYSNTFAPVEKLRALYDEALKVPDVQGLIIGTRPDCLPDDVLRLLAEFSQKTYLWLELGLQSAIDRTLAAINRGHDTGCFIDAVSRCREHGIRVCAHLIFGLPGESREETLSSAALLNRLGVQGVKIHHLHIIKGTKLEELYLRGKVNLLTREEYIALVCDFLEMLDPRTLVMRLKGDGGDNLVAPEWGTGRFDILNAIDGEMELRGSRQGSRSEGMP